MLEPNVRDYQGENNPVNRDIRDTLGSSETPEFWWLNNGITILTDTAPSIGAQGVQMDGAEIVNGLQTCVEIFTYYKAHSGEEQRTVLVRVIQPPDEKVRRKITKATNNQTVVNPLSLHATEDIHFSIEELLALYSLFYDRKKGKYRRLRRPVSKIVSMRSLAQAVMAIALRQPADARARPMTVLGNQAGYNNVFDISVSRDLFVTCILLDRQVDAYLGTRDDLHKDIRTDVRYYIGMWLAGILTKRSQPTKADIAALVKTANAPLPKDLLDSACNAVVQIYMEKGGDDTVAKGPNMTPAIIVELKEKLNEKA